MDTPEVTKEQQLAELGSRLGQLNEELYRLPDDAYEQRLELREQIAEVRARISEIRARPTPAGRHELEAELRRLEQQWDALAADRIDVVKQAGGGSMGGDFGFAADAMRINREIDASTGRAEIEARIAYIKDQLKALEGDPAE